MTQTTNTKALTMDKPTSRADAAAARLAARIAHTSDAARAHAAHENAADAAKSHRSGAPADAAARLMYVMPARRPSIKTYHAPDAAAATQAAAARAAHDGQAAAYAAAMPAIDADVLPYDDVRRAADMPIIAAWMPAPDADTFDISPDADTIARRAEREQKAAAALAANIAAAADICARADAARKQAAAAWKAYNDAAANARHASYEWARRDTARAMDRVKHDKETQAAINADVCAAWLAADAADDAAAALLPAAIAADAALIDDADAKKLLAYYAPAAIDARAADAAKHADIAARLDAKKAAHDAAPAPAIAYDAAAIAAINAMNKDARAAWLAARKTEKDADSIAAQKALSVFLSSMALRAKGMPDNAADIAAAAYEHIQAMPWFVGPLPPPQWARQAYIDAIDAARIAVRHSKHCSARARLADATRDDKAIAYYAADAADIAVKNARHAAAIAYKAGKARIQAVDDAGILYAACRAARACVRLAIVKMGAAQKAANDEKQKEGKAPSMGAVRKMQTLYAAMMPAYMGMVSTGAGILPDKDNATLSDAAECISAAAIELYAWRAKGIFPYQVTGEKTKKSGKDITPMRKAMYAVRSHIYGERGVRGKYTTYTSDTIEAASSTLSRIEPDAAAALLYDDVMNTLKAAGCTAYQLAILAARIKGDKVTDIAAAHHITHGRVSQHLKTMRDILHNAGIDAAME